VTLCPARSAVGPSIQNTELSEIRSYTGHLGRRAGVICLWDLRSYSSPFCVCFFFSWKTTNDQEKKSFCMQTGAAASSHDLSSRFQENTEWNKVFEESAAASNAGNFSRKNYGRSLPRPWKAGGCAVLVLALFHLGQMRPAASLCRPSLCPAFVI